MKSRLVAAIIVTLSFVSLFAMLSLAPLVSADEEQIGGGDPAHMSRTSTFLIDSDGGTLYNSATVLNAPSAETYVHTITIFPDYSALRLWGIDSWIWDPNPPLPNVRVICTDQFDAGETRDQGWEYYSYTFTTFDTSTGKWIFSMTPWSHPGYPVFTIVVKLPPYATEISTTSNATVQTNWVEDLRPVYKFEATAPSDPYVEAIELYITYKIAQPSASLQFTADSPVNILVTSPRERRVGYDIVGGGVIDEIPGATYSGPGSEPQVIVIPTPTAGNYLVDAYGTGNGPYVITVKSLDSNGKVIGSQILTGVAVINGHYSYVCQMVTDGKLPFLRVKMELFPNPLILKCKINWIMAYLELPRGFDAAKIDVSTISLAGAIPANKDIIKIPFSKRMIIVKFGGNAVRTLLASQSGWVKLTVTGRLCDGTFFEGSDTIRVVK